jgi:DNA repair exonuclease SbcCD ATPase subunit
MKLESVDIDQELIAHRDLKAWTEKNTQLTSLRRQKATFESAMIQADKTVNRYTQEIQRLANKSCPACEQELHDHKHTEMTESAEKNLLDAKEYQANIQKELATVDLSIGEIGDLTHRPNTFYDTEAEALGHKNNVDSLEKSITARIDEKNPYDEQVEELKKTALLEISWNAVNSLTRLKDHQEFLYKLLTNKDSFVRKKIIDQNLSYLNKRLGYYINKLGLPHLVVFQNDLTVEITQLGQDLDFDNLSRGERNRLILSMSFAFRDVWEGLYQSINLLFIDELLDSGMDGAGIEAGLSVLKKMARERNKNIYLISHKDELIGRVNNVLQVVKENGFTSYSNSVDYVN